MTPFEEGLLAFIIGAMLVLCLQLPAPAIDRGQWDEGSPAIKEWYENLKQPDHPNTSCCGEADAYWADAYEVTPEGQYVAIVTDTRDNVKLGRTPVPVGTRIVIWNHKITFKQSNPTGHGIVFLSSGVNSGETAESRANFVYCYLPPGGV